MFNLIKRRTRQYSLSFRGNVATVRISRNRKRSFRRLTVAKPDAKFYSPRKSRRISYVRFGAGIFNVSHHRFAQKFFSLCKAVKVKNAKRTRHRRFGAGIFDEMRENRSSESRDSTTGTARLYDRASFQSSSRKVTAISRRNFSVMQGNQGEKREAYLDVR